MTDRRATLRRLVLERRDLQADFAEARLRIIDAEAGSYAVTGQDAALTYSQGAVLDAQPGSYVITGMTAALLRGLAIAAAPGAITLTGSPVFLRHARAALAAEAGAYALTGQDATFARSYVLAAAPGSYVVAGQTAQLVYSAAPEPEDTGRVPRGMILTPGRLMNR